MCCTIRVITCVIYKFPRSLLALVTCAAQSDLSHTLDSHLALITCAAKSESSHALEDFPHPQFLCYICCAVAITVCTIQTFCHSYNSLVTRTVDTLLLSVLDTNCLSHPPPGPVTCTLPSVTQFLCRVCCPNPVTAFRRQNFHENLFYFIMIRLRAGRPENRGLFPGRSRDLIL
jgi:hypothetical protein